jgi:hypothetical protein
MTTWTPPADTSLSVDGIDHVVAGLTDPTSRDAALAFVDEITDSGLLYVLACRVKQRDDKPWAKAPAAGLRAFIRNRV